MGLNLKGEGLLLLTIVGLLVFVVFGPFVFGFFSAMVI
jgi:hypothetical protein